jgi:outer membrane protein assembly factor BamA
MEFTNIRGVLFTDLGGVYSDSFQVYSTDGGFHLQDLKMGIGAGLRFNLFYMIFKLDFSRPTDLQRWLPNEPDGDSHWRFDLTLGSEW